MRFELKNFGQNCKITIQLVFNYEKASSSYSLKAHFKTLLT